MGNCEVMMKSCLSTGQVQIKDWCFPNGFILTQAPTHIGKHTHTQSLSGLEKIKLWFQFVFLSIHCWITDTLNASLHVSDLRKHSQSDHGFFPDLKKKNRKISAIFMRSLWKMREERDKQTHPSRQKKNIKGEMLKNGLRTQNSSIKDKNVHH